MFDQKTSAVSPTCSLEPPVQGGKTDLSDWYWFFALALISLFIYLPLLRTELGLGFDPALYLSGARSLAGGAGYHYAGFIGNPRIGFYPPLQSVLLAPFCELGDGFPTTLPLMGLVMWSVMMLSLASVFEYWRRCGLPLWIRLSLLASWSVAPTWLLCVALLMADPGFTGLIMVLALPWVAARDEPSSSRWLVTGIGLAFAYWWRTAALGLIVGVLILAAWQVRRGKFAPLLLVGLPTMLGLLLWRCLNHGATGYSDVMRGEIADLGGLSGYSDLVIKNLGWCLRGLPFFDSWCPAVFRLLNRFGGGNFLSVVLEIGGFSAVVALIVRGWWRLRTDFNRAAGLLVVLYLVQMLPHPCNAAYFQRYIYPILPFLIVWLWHGLEGWDQFLRKPWLVTVTATALFINAGFNLRFAYADHRNTATAISIFELREIVTWLRAQTPPEARIAAGFEVPHQQLSALLGRPLIVNYLAPLNRWQPFSHREQGYPRADYLILGGSQKLKAIPLDLLESVKESSSGCWRVFKVAPAAEARFRKATGVPSAE